MMQESGSKVVCDICIHNEVRSPVDESFVNAESSQGHLGVLRWDGGGNSDLFAEEAPQNGASQDLGKDPWKG